MPPSSSFSIGKIRFGANAPLFLIAGPCVIESEAHATSMAERLGAIAARAGHSLTLQSVLRQSQSLVGRFLSRPGTGRRPADSALRLRNDTGLPILTDVHDVSQVGPAAEVCDVSADSCVPLPPDRPARCGGTHRPRRQSEERPVPFAVGNGQRGGKSRQHRKREDHSHRTRRVRSAIKILSWTCARLPIMRKTGYPVVFDVTHSVQLPGAAGQLQRRPAGIHRAAGARRHVPRAWTDFSRSA